MGMQMDRKEISEFEGLQSQLQALYEQVSALASSAPDTKTGELKVRIASGVLRQVRNFLPDNSGPLEPVELKEDVTHSDVALVLALTISALKTWRLSHTKERHGKLYWVVDENDYVPVRDVW